VDGLDQQVHQVVGQAAGAQVDECGQPGEARCIGMSAQVAGNLDRYALPAAFQVARRRLVEEIGGQLDARISSSFASSSCMLARLGGQDCRAASAERPARCRRLRLEHQ
jgi:predicted metal-binding protein